MSKKVILISGFTEGRFERTGTYRLYKKMRDKFGEVILCEWNDDFEKLAKLLRDEGVSEILVCAYSWGAGNGLVELAKHYRRSINAILCDPVYRSKYPWMRWRALTNKFFQPTIRYSHNVKVVRWFNQTVNKPSGHMVTAGTIIPDKPTTLNVEHSKIDDTESYQKSCLTAAEVFLGQK